jgi:hypothetical protein
MTDTAVVEMEAAGAALRARIKAHRESKMKDQCFAWITQPMPMLRLAYQPREIPRAVLTSKLLTKAAQVRDKIAEAKKKHQSHNSVVEWAVQNLQMSKGQAARYVTENWKRA